MKNLVLVDIVTGVAAKIKSGSLQHLQTAYTEMIKLACQAVAGSGFDPSAVNTGYVIYGCTNSGSGGFYVIAEGLVLYNGILYRVPATSFTTSGADVPVMTLTVSYTTATNYDPVLFTDGSSHNIHQDKTLVVSSGTSGTTLLDYSALVWTGTARTVTPTLTAHYTTSSTVKVHKVGGRVEFSGALVCNASAVANETITTLPVEFRPLTIRYVTHICDSFGGLRLVTFRIQTSGVVDIFGCENKDAGGPTAITSMTFYLDNVGFRI